MFFMRTQENGVLVLNHRKYHENVVLIKKIALSWVVSISRLLREREQELGTGSKLCYMYPKEGGQEQIRCTRPRKQTAGHTTECRTLALLATEYNVDLVSLLFRNNQSTKRRSPPAVQESMEAERSWRKVGGRYKTHAGSSRSAAVVLVLHSYA